MAGNKYPEITEKTILDTAKKLFLEKGYEHVTLQDIADACGLTRGGQSIIISRGKVEMIDAVTDYMFNAATFYQDIKVDASLNGLEKLRRLFVASMTDDEHIKMYAMLSQTFYKSPKLVSAYLLDCQNSVIPITQEYIEEGIADGSIKGDSSEYLAEIVMVFTNLWLSPLVFKTTKEKLLLRVKYTKLMLESIGLPLINDEVILAIEKMCKVLYQE